jgi:uncharacterized membrane protein
MVYVKILTIGVLAMIILDIIWIGGIMSGFYKGSLKDFLRFGENGSLSPRILPAILVYIAGALFLTIFVLPLIKASIASGNSLWVASLWGALAGLLMYSFYDLTNLALFEKWTVVITLVDILWGTVLFYITTLMLVFIS